MTVIFSNKKNILLPFSIKNDLTIGFSSTPNLIVSIRQTVNIKFKINVPSFSNIRLMVNFSCVQSGVQFARIDALGISSIGKNIDGLEKEYQAQLLKPVFSRKDSSANFHQDTVEFDLGIITNTSIIYLFL